MPDEDAVTITKNKRLLEAIRAEKEKETDVSKQSGSGVSDRYATGHDDRIRPPTGSDDSPTRENGTASTKVREGSRYGREDRGTEQRIYEGIRPSDRPGINTTQGPDTGSRRSKEDIRFTLKNPFKRDKGEPVKLFTEAEAKGEYERMYEIYFRGSGLLDDLLEICVKGHEPVQIWQLDDDEAATLAQMHLQRATYDKKAAQSARQLLALYDRLYMYILVVPRAKLTYTHVKIHGGFSFR